LRPTYSLRSFAVFWTFLFIFSFLAFLYVIFNLFFSEQITDSSLKDLKHSSHLAKLKLSEEKERMKNSLALHVGSKEFIDYLERKEFSRIAKLITNWEAIGKGARIELYDKNGVLFDLTTGAVSKKLISLSEDIVTRLSLGYEEVDYNVGKNGLRLSVQRKIFSSTQNNLGYLLERKVFPYDFFVEEENRELIVKNYSGVVYSSEAFSGKQQLSESAFQKGAGAFELNFKNRVFDVVRVDMAKGIAFFIARENLRNIVFSNFYKKYFGYFLVFIIVLLILFYLSYYIQVFRPLEMLSEFIVEGDREKLERAESSIGEIQLIANKLNEKLASLNADIEENKAGRINDVARLVSSVAHELNNSLAYLGGNLSYLKEELEHEDTLDKSELLDALGSAQLGYDRIKNIVADLKVFSSKTSVKIEWIDVISIKSMLELEFEEVDISFPSNLASFEVETDLSRVGQVLKNLILNSKQAYEDQSHPKVLVSFYLAEDGLVVSVKDWAGGVPPETVSKIFEPFFTTKKNLSGTGLGLAVSQNLAAEIGGDLSLKSTSSEGSEFSLKLKHFRSKAH